MKQAINFLIFIITLAAQFVASYLFAFVTLMSIFGIFNLGASATEPDPTWVIVLVYTITAMVMGLGMLLIGWGVAKLRKQTPPSLYHYIGSVVAGGLGWAWLESAPLGQTRSPLVLILVIFIGYYFSDIVGLFSNKNEDQPAE